jgi:ABC-type nitrate/sulfonate/bicarbonate transport system permease component
MTGRAGKLLPWISTAVAIVVIVVIWKLVIAIFNVSPFVLPQPEDVLRGVRELVQSKNFWSDARVTLEETLIASRSRSSWASASGSCSDGSPGSSRRCAP